MLFQNNAVVTCLDVDGNLPMDLCTKYSDTYTVIEQFMNESGKSVSFLTHEKKEQPIERTNIIGYSERMFLMHPVQKQNEAVMLMLSLKY